MTFEAACRAGMVHCPQCDEVISGCQVYMGTLETGPEGTFVLVGGEPGRGMQIGGSVWTLGPNRTSWHDGDVWFVEPCGHRVNSIAFKVPTDG